MVLAHAGGGAGEQRRSAMQGIGHSTSTPLALRNPAQPARWSTLAQTAFPFLVARALWEIAARLQFFPARLFPSLEAVAAALIRLTATGVLPHHTFNTLLRLLAGFVLAAMVGIAIGVLMGRYRRAEDCLLPLISMGAPIPGIAYAPLFMLWFGLCDFSVVALFALLAAFTIRINT